MTLPTLGYTAATLLVLLPVLTLGTFVLSLYVRLGCWRTAILGGAVIWGVVLAVSTEALSALNHLGAVELAICWLAALLVGAVYVAVSRTRLHTRHLAAARKSLGQVSPLSSALFAGLVTLVLVLAAVATLSPPNTWDSMTYHMARLIHWMQSASLTPYPTHILRQLYLQPGAEFILLHLQLLSGGDRFAGLVQWAAMVGTLVGTSLVARDLGADHPGQLAAAVVAASIPIGILESTSTQNDYVVAFWLVCGAAFALRVTRASRTKVPWGAAAAFGASMGLALLTKATAYLAILPFLLWVGASLLRAYGLRRAWYPIAAVAVVAVALNAGVYTRNLAVFGSPGGPLNEAAPNDGYLNAALTPALLASNVVRDMGLNLVATPLAPLNAAGESLVLIAHHALGVDSADSRTTWGTETFVARSPGLAFDENFASNPIHMILLMLAVIGVTALRRSLPPAISTYSVAIVAGFLLFCAVLRWQPWHTRLELPLFVLGAPLIATLIDRVAPRLLGPLAIVLLVSMIPWVAYNQARPLVGPRSILTATRDGEYFTNQPGLRSPYLGAVAFLADHACGQVGFASTEDGWEYPLWPLLKRAVSGPVTIEHVEVTNVSAAWQGRDGARFEPCAIVSIDQSTAPVALLVNGRTFQQAWTMGQVTVSTPRDY